MTIKQVVSPGNSPLCLELCVPRGTDFFQLHTTKDLSNLSPLITEHQDKVFTLYSIYPFYFTDYPHKLR